MTVLREWDVPADIEGYMQMYGAYIREEGSPVMLAYLNTGEARQGILAAFRREERPCRCWQITEDDNVRGFLTIRYDPDSVWLADFYVFAEDRNRGIGTAALKEFISLHRGKAIRLTPSPKAVTLYRRFGFEPTDTCSEDNGQVIWELKGEN
ncbi:MAG: GNAT family N-acetyltransferase [Solobacterium sp.]|nr:GNAT family N-acetyltransferase [Solobacterium sp.]